MENSTEHAASATSSTAQVGVPGMALKPLRTRGKDREERKRVVKVGWTAVEDELLTRGVAQYGSSGTAWAKIAETFEGTRCSKQCRERWTEYIDPAYNRGHFTDEEDKLLLEIQPFYGNQWKEISHQLACKFQLRSSTRIKSRWTQLQRKKKGNNLKPIDGKEKKSDTSETGLPVAQASPAKRARRKEAAVSDVEVMSCTRVYADMPTYPRLPSQGILSPTECSEDMHGTVVGQNGNDETTFVFPHEYDHNHASQLHYHHSTYHPHQQYFMPPRPFHYPMQTSIVPSYQHTQWVHYPIYASPFSSSDTDPYEHTPFMPCFPFSDR